MVAGLLVAVGFVMLGGFAMMLGGMLVMLGCSVMVLDDLFLGHPFLRKTLPGRPSARLADHRRAMLQPVAEAKSVR